MVSSKKVQCAYCQKKCSGTVLRYQDQYYHKLCFESLQGELAPKQQQQQQQRHQPQQSQQQQLASTNCAGCKENIRDGQALVALDLHWHVSCFKCTHCKALLHGEYVAKDGRAYCEKDYQKLFGITCVYCKRFITGKVLQAGEAHHFHPSCARCSKCGDPFVPGEEMYLQGEVTWHPRCGPGPAGLPLSPSQLNDTNSTLGPGEDSALESSQSRSQLRAARARSPSLSSRSRSASPYSYMSRQLGRTSPAYTESEAVGDLSRIYTISYLNADPNQGYLKRPLEPYPPKSPQFSRPTSLSRIGASDRSRCSSRSQQLYSSTAAAARDRSVPPRGMYSVLSGMGRSGTSSSRARSPSMMNEEAIQLAAYPSGRKPSPDSVPKIERDDFPAPPFPHQPQQHHHHHHQHHNYNHSHSHRSHHHEARGQSAPRSSSPAPAANGTRAEEPVEIQERASRPRSREFATPTSSGRNGNHVASGQRDRCPSLSATSSSNDDEHDSVDPQFRKEEEELSKIANGIGKIFLQTLKEREKLRAWKRANLDPRNASRTPSATRELPGRPLRYENPTNASPSRDLDRPRPWEGSELQQDDGESHSPTRTRSSLGRSTAAATGRPQSSASSSYGYKVVQANRNVPKPGYGLGGGTTGAANGTSELSFAEQQQVAQARAADLLGRQQVPQSHLMYGFNRPLASSASAYLRRSMPNVANSRDSTLGAYHQQQHQQHSDGPPKLYPYHLLATTNYRLPPDVDRCHLERHLSNEEFQYIFHCDRLDFYRLPEWRRNELKRRAKLF